MLRFYFYHMTYFKIMFLRENAKILPYIWEVITAFFT